ncbi:hypothetical protein RF16_21100 [Salmonella enterica subsp. enterica]|nr:hypothetical protein [Salmonella enterica subsp. enterica]EDX5007247.1 hypothetical protein [Salmonella enterica subsp. houtenae]EGO0678670.1 hypothetical protein [Salmonella enterica]EEJ7380852.1 hypothetical protein [Salmonella enterica subsp. enterica]EGO0733660.1 hypothetical protein [Salmonella enterica]
MNDKFCVTLASQKSSDKKEIINNWYYKCKNMRIPYIYVNQKLKTSSIHYDYITQNTDHDAAFAGQCGEQLTDKVREIVCKFSTGESENRIFLQCYAWVIYINDVPNNIAFNVASELFDVIQNHINGIYDSGNK